MTSYDNPAAAAASASPATPATYEAAKPHPDPRDQLGHGASGHGPDTHHVGLTTYLVIFAILMVLLIVTVAAAFLDFGHPVANIVIAMSIAAVKTAAVVLYFMHVKFSSRLTQVFVVSGVFFLAILFTLLLADYETRDALPSSRGWTDNLPVSAETGRGRATADGRIVNIPANRSDDEAARHEVQPDAPPQPQTGTNRRRD